MKSILKKASLFLYCIILSLLTGKLYAQQYTQAIVKISQTPIDISTLARTIAKQTGLEYSLNMQNASLKKQIRLKQGNLHLSDILKQIQLQAGLNYKIIGDHIIFMDYQPGGSTKTPELKKKKSVPQVKTDPVVRRLFTFNPIKIQPLYFFDVKAPLLAQFPPIDHFKLIATLFVPKEPDLWRDSSSHKKKKIQPKQNEPTTNADIERGKWYRPFVKAGFSADEVLYANASLMAGIKYVYGIISYGTGFTGSGGRFRWGGGIPVKLKNQQQLHLNFTTGTCVRADTSLRSFKERLTRYGVAWSKIYNTKWTFQVQLHYNNLTKPFYYSPIVPKSYEHFYYGKIPYNFSGSDFNKKQWLGIQLSLMYSLY